MKSMTNTCIAAAAMHGHKLVIIVKIESKKIVTIHLSKGKMSLLLTAGSKTCHGLSMKN